MKKEAKHNKTKLTPFCGRINQPKKATKKENAQKNVGQNENQIPFRFKGSQNQSLGITTTGFLNPKPRRNQGGESN